MKASELMIGDWVMYNPNVFIEDEYEPHKDCESVQIKSGEDIDLAIEGCFAPIHLTKDILKANGFKFSAETGVIRYVYLTPDDSVFVEPMNVESRLGETWFWFENGRRDLDVIRPKCFIPFTYVHELQHALRLCGLIDLADNFKLTADGVKAHTSAQKNMKASELMIGDWVRVKPHKGYYEGITQVLGIPDRSTLKHNGHVDVELRYFDEIEDCDSYEVEDCEDRHIEPITLTEEILRLNGFVDENATNGLSFRWYVLQTNQEYGDVWGRTNHTITVAWRECNSDVYIERPYGTDMQQKVIVADIRYVHELQHALRLCGLTDLADNFKVVADDVTTNASAQR